MHPAGQWHYLYWKVTAVSECPSNGHELLVVSSAQFCAVLWSLHPGGLRSYNSIFIIFCPLLVLHKAIRMLNFYERTSLSVRTFIRNTGETARGHSLVLPILEFCYWFHKSLRRRCVNYGNGCIVLSTKSTCLQLNSCQSALPNEGIPK